MESQDHAEVGRIKGNVEECRKTLQSLGYADFTVEDFFAVNYYIFLSFFLAEIGYLFHFFYIWELGVLYLCILP